MTFCHAITTAGNDPWWMARIRDISPDGFGLTCGQRFEVGTFLAVELQTSNQSFPRVVSSRVAHVGIAPDSYSWFIGCEFVSKLNEDEFNSLLS
jgi:hypothetical protein